MKGIKIVDLSRVLAGPLATQMLADQGAEVIKIEPPGGDDTRQFGPTQNGVSTYYLSANRNKRSIAIDLKTDSGREVIYRALEGADVLVENFRPDVASRIGLDWPELHQRFPSLIYVAIYAFGDEVDKQWRSRPGYDLVLQAMGGAMAATGVSGDPPLKCANSIADVTSALMAVQAILLGLLHRERTGETQKIVINMMQTAAVVQAYHATKYSITGEVDKQRGNSHGGLVPYNVYRCRDGWLAVAVGNDVLWQRLVSSLSLPENPEWTDGLSRLNHREEIDAAVQEALKIYSVREADQLLASAGVPAGPVLRFDEAFEHPSVQRVTVDHPTIGEFEMAGPPFQSKTTRSTHTPPPQQSEHAEELLQEFGYTQEEILQMFQDGIISQA